jgi:uncharacterized protein
VKDNRLKQIFVYPVKSFEEVSLSEVRISSHGHLENDRLFSIVKNDGNPEVGHHNYVNGKNEPKVFELKIRYVSASNELLVKDKKSVKEENFELSAGHTAVDHYLSDFFGYSVRLSREEKGYLDGSKSALTLISTATLKEMSNWYGDLTPEEICLRLRPNLVVEGEDEPFWEDHIRGKVKIGDVELEFRKHMERCSVPPRDPETGKVHKEFIKKFKQLRPVLETEKHNYFATIVFNRLGPSEHGKTLRVGDQLIIN